MILTDAHGVPIPRPEREDYPSDVEFIRAMHRWRDLVTECANHAFDAAFVGAATGVAVS